MKSRSNRAILSPQNRFLGYRHVMYNPVTREYVDMTCRGSTPDRMWAWSGTSAQSRAAREVFGIGQEYCLFEDGEEKFFV